MTSRLRDESGIALISAILLLSAAMALGLGAVAWSDGQQTQVRQERTRESSFNLAEAALNAEIFQLSQNWFATSTGTQASCTSASTGTTFCPSPAEVNNGYTAGDTNNDFTGGTTAPCPGSPPLWTVTVRDDAPAGRDYYSQSVVDPQVPYDGDGNGTVWVRATSMARCHPQTLVTKVSRQLISLDMPHSVMTANWFRTTNSGRKVIIDTKGTKSTQPADLTVRCNPAPTGITFTAGPCLGYDKSKNQVSPDTASTNTGLSAQTLTDAQLDTMRQLAKSQGTYYPNASATCPSGSQLTSPVVQGLGTIPIFVEGPCNVNGSANSAASPGILVVMNGTYSIGGTGVFYGLLYCADKQASSGAVVSLSGNASITGAVMIDGQGGFDAGSSKTNLVFDPTALSMTRGFAGAAIAKGTWRLLPAGQ
jgi:hypothetical protein